MLGGTANIGMAQRTATHVRRLCASASEDHPHALCGFGTERRSGHARHKPKSVSKRTGWRDRHELRGVSTNVTLRSDNALHKVQSGKWDRRSHWGVFFWGQGRFLWNIHIRSHASLIFPDFFLPIWVDDTGSQPGSEGDRQPHPQRNAHQNPHPQQHREPHPHRSPASAGPGDTRPPLPETPGVELHRVRGGRGGGR